MGNANQPRRAANRLAEERARLEQLRDGLTPREPSGTTELSSTDQHPADSATETFEREKEAAILDRVLAQLADVERAERMLARGEYGRCEACGRPIERQRLEALPAARLCLSDQESRERERV